MNPLSIAARSLLVGLSAATALAGCSASVADSDAAASGTPTPAVSDSPDPPLAEARCPDRDEPPTPEGPSATAVVAQQADGERPQVDVVTYPRPSYDGNPWSHWGQGLVLSDGRLLTAMGDHRGVDGNSFLLVYDPDTQQITRVGDVASAIGGDPSWGFGKVHGQIVPGACGEAFLSTYWGTRTGLEYSDSYRGDVLLRVDTDTLAMTPVSTVVEEHGVPSLAGSPDGRYLFAEAVDPTADTDRDTGAFVVLDPETGETLVRDDTTEHIGFRNVMVDAEGSAYLAAADGRLLVYQPGADELSEHPQAASNGGVLRASTQPTVDGRVFFVTTKPEHFYEMDATGSIRAIGPAEGYTTSMAAEPDGSRFYYVPGAHGGSTELGTSVVAVDTRSGERTTLARLDDLLPPAVGLYPAGSYSVALDPVNRLLHVTLNAGTSPDERWGEVALAVVHLPATAPAAAGDEAATDTTAFGAGGPLVCTAGPPAPTPPGPQGVGPIAFEDATEALGALGPLTGMRGHAVAAADVNADGWTDLFVGTFADRDVSDYQQRGAPGPAPDRLLLGGPDGFEADPTFPGSQGRTSGAAFADLDNDGDVDLVIARNVRDNARENAPGSSPSAVLRNDDGSFTVAGTLREPAGARSVGLLDYDDDGLLDLFVAEDRFSGGSSVLLRNSGDLSFTDVTAAAGLGADVAGLGVGTGDLDADGDPDLLVGGSNRLFVNQGDATFVEQVDAIAGWPTFGDEDDPAGVAQADLNGDGRLDVVIGQHYNSTVDFDREVSVRLYLNETSPGGTVRLADVTERAGLVGLPTKSPHVQVADVDADGLPDIVTTAAGTDGRPIVFRQRGDTGPNPTFEASSTPGSAQYWVSAALVDVDRDGALDVVAVEWEPSLPTQVWRNVGPTGHWLEVDADPGNRVDVYPVGGLGQRQDLLGTAVVGASTGYAAGPALTARFGLGTDDRGEVDVEVTTADGQTTALTGVEVDQTVVCARR